MDELAWGRSPLREAAERVRAIEASPLPEESAIVPVPDEIRGEEVKACIVLREGCAPSPELLEGLIRHCQRQLAPFKVPRYFSFHDSFPLTASAKIAKKALQPEGSDPRRGSFDRVENRWH